MGSSRRLTGWMIALCIGAIGCGESPRSAPVATVPAVPESADADAPELPLPERGAEEPPEVERVTIAVDVLDETGQPLAGARVRAFGDQTEAQWFRAPRAAPGAKPLASASSDRAGHVVIEIADGAPTTLVVDAPGYVAEVVEIAEVAGAPDAAQVAAPIALPAVVLRPGHVLEGLVTDRHGVAIEGARVRFGSDYDHFTGLEPEVVTDERGRYRWDGAPPGLVQVNVSPPGVSSTLVEGVSIPSVGVFDVRVSLHGPISGRVRDPDTSLPVAGATVVAELGGFHSESVHTEVVTDAEGRYTIPLWPKAGVGRVSPRKDGWYWRLGPDGADTTGLSIPAEGLLKVDLWMSRGARVEGVVRGPEGEALAGASVTLHEQRGEGMHSTQTDANGQYTLDGLPPGDFLALVDHPHYLGDEWPDDPNGVIKAGDPLPRGGVRVEKGTVITLDCELPQGEVVTGTALEADGAPASGIELYGSRGKRALSNADGTFRISGLPIDGEFEIGVLSSSWSPSKLTFGPDDPPEDRTGVTLRLTPNEGASAATTSVVVDVRDADGADVPGASIAARPHGHGDALDALTSDLSWRAAAEDGSLSTEVENYGDVVTVFGRAPGFAPALVEIVRDGEAGVLRSALTLQRESVIHGTVRAKGDDRPLSAVRVSVRRPPDPVRGIACRHGQDFGPPTVATTDGTGAFSIRGLPDGEVQLTFSRIGFVGGQVVTRLRRGESTSVDFALRRPRTIRGHVVDADGRPVAGVGVRAWRDYDSAPDGVGDDGQSARAVTNSDGAFELEGLSRGTFEVTATPEGIVTYDVEAELERVDPTDGDVRLQLPDLRRITGTVRDQEGNPVGRALIRHALVDEEEDPADRGFDEARTDALGRYTIVAPADRSVVIVASGPGLAARSRTFVLGDDAGEFRLDEGLAIAGVLRDADGEPIVGTPISARRTDGSTPFDSVPTATTDAEGRFRIVGLSEGGYRLCERYQLSDQSLFEPRDVAAGAEDLEVTKVEPVDLSLVVVDDRGHPLREFSVTIMRRGGGRVTSSDDEGRVQYSDLRPGSVWELELGGIGVLADPKQRAVAGREGQRVVVTETQRMSGQLVDGAGEPVAERHLDLRAIEDADEAQVRVRTDHDGRFVAHGLSADRYAIWLVDGEDWVEIPGAFGVEDDLTISLE